MDVTGTNLTTAQHAGVTEQMTTVEDFTPTTYWNATKQISEMPPFGYHMASIVYFGLSIPMAIAGNILLLVTVSRNKCLHKPAMYYVCNLACGDLIFATFCSPIYLVNNISGHVAVPELVCQAHAFFTQMCAFQTLLTLTAISVDRYYAICHPLTYYKSKVRSRWSRVLVYTWGHASIVAGLPLLGFSRYQSYDYLYGCHMVWNNSDVVVLMFVFFVGLSTFFPCTLMIVLSYVYILKAARRAAHSEPPAIHTGHSLLNLLAKDIRIAKTGVIIIGTFVMCWFPFVGLRSTRIFVTSPVTLARVRQGEIVSLFLFTIANYINPFIYGIYNREVRAAYRNLLCKKVPSNSGASSNTSETRY